MKGGILCNMNCNIHNFPDEKTPYSIGAFPIILDENNKILLAHRTDYDIWNCPGGGMDDSETPDQAAIREAKEEVGVDIEIIRCAGVYPKKDKNEIVFSFVAKIVGGTLQYTEEADDIAWFSFEDLPRNMSLAQIERIVDALYEPDKMHYRVQSNKGTIALYKSGELEKETDTMIKNILNKKIA